MSDLVTTVRVESLVLAGSPRLSGEDLEHTRLLAEADADLPPIVVHRPTMRVIDGMHRVRAALLNGRSEIRARLLDCDEDSAFVLAVEANVTHGLPLSQSDRKAAAARIIASLPDWSDRAVAASTGLSDKTVSRIRACSTPDVPQSNGRLGKDGRVRPLNSAAKRRQAAAMLVERPEAGLREIARATGLSPATVRDVRERTERSEDPVPLKYRIEEPSSSPTQLQLVSGQRQHKTRLDDLVDTHELLAKLRNDPSLKFNEAGRRTLRWLHQHVVDSQSWESQRLSVPEHCTTVVADLAKSCAISWIKLAERLEERLDGGDD